MFSGFMKEKSTIDSIFDVYDDFNNIVLVFDDFERCKINIIELLGFISSFLEKGDLKIIVIANENEIINVQTIDKLEERYNFALNLHNAQNVTKESTKHNENNNDNKVVVDRNYLTDKIEEFFNTLDQYNKMKEKVFGYTITIKNNIENLYDSIIEEYKNNNYLYNMLKENKKLILEISSYIKSNNLRILKRSFDSLESILNESDIKLNEIKQKEIRSEIEKSIISFTIIFYNIINLNYINFDSSVRECETSELKFSYGKRNNYFVYMYENFVQRMKNNVNIIHFKSIVEFIIDGEISKSKLNEDIDTCNEIFLFKKVDDIQKDKRDIAEKLLDFDIMSENEFTLNVDLFRSNVKKGVYHTKCYKKILQIILMLRENNLINYEINDIESLLKEGVNNSDLKGRIIFSHSEFNYGIEEKTVREINNFINKKLVEFQNNDDKENLNRILKMLESDFENALTSLNNDYIEVNKLFFSTIDIKLFIDSIKKMDNYQLTQIYHFIRRKYGFSNIGEFYGNEKNDIEILKTYICELEFEDSIKMFNIQRLIKECDIIINKIN